MNKLYLLFIGIIFTFFTSTAFAWPAFVADTWNSNQLYAGSVYVPSSPYSGWTYNAYYPNSGYPVMGGGRYFPSGYNAGYFFGTGPNWGVGSGYYGGYAPANYPGHFVSGSYYGAPVHSTFEVGFGNNNFYARCSYYSC